MNEKKYNPRDYLNDEQKELVKLMTEEIGKKSIEEQIKIHRKLAHIMALTCPDENILCVFDDMLITAIDIAHNQSKQDVFAIFDEVVLRTRNSIVGFGGITPYDPETEWRLNSQDPREITEELYRKAQIRLNAEIAKSSETELISWQWLMKYVNEWYLQRMAEYAAELAAQTASDKDIKEKYPTEDINKHINELYKYMSGNGIVSGVLPAEILMAVGFGDFSGVLGKIMPRKRNAFESVLFAFYDHVIVKHLAEADMWRQDVETSLGVQILASNRNRLSKEEQKKIASFARKIKGSS